MYENNLNAAPGSAVSTAAGFNSASGPIPIRMTNDYLFRALLQRNNRVLKGLIASLLHLDASAIASVEITNPIELGSAISDKTFFLDVKVLMNGSAVINLEMQVLNEHNWPERSLSYLCRAFDSLNSGEGYHLVKASVQIGLLDFTLFPKYPEFYATYQFLNIKNHMLYSDKLRLSVVDLTQTDLATAEDRLYHIDCWAMLFKAATWEEIKMLAQKDDFIRDASSTIYQLSQDEKIRLQCEAREDYYRRQHTTQCLLKEKDDKIEQQAAMLAEKDAELSMQKAENERLRAMLAQYEK